ncbi:unnamed protein product [Adineta ricciae]|uniref:Uncharacterized protein n=1 Tax=Adineta ricciae TaxID=249248 RepID=A0A816H203_ADIRI|nr:unnamed protein product [Adineta ricciae]
MSDNSSKNTPKAAANSTESTVCEYNIQREIDKCEQQLKHELKLHGLAWDKINSKEEFIRKLKQEIDTLIIQESEISNSIKKLKTKIEDLREKQSKITDKN